MSSDEREIRDKDLMDVAEDPVRARRLHHALRTMRDDPAVGGSLQRMAREVLSGRMSISDVAGTDDYLHALGDRMTRIRHAAEQVESLSPQEQEQRREQVERWQEKRAEQAAGADQGDAPSRQPVAPKRRRHNRGRA